MRKDISGSHHQVPGNTNTFHLYSAEPSSGRNGAYHWGSLEADTAGAAQTERPCDRHIGSNLFSQWTRQNCQILYRADALWRRLQNESRCVSTTSALNIFCVVIVFALPKRLTKRTGQTR